MVPEVDDECEDMIFLRVSIEHATVLIAKYIGLEGRGWRR
jgi:hypothetical protein